MPFTQRLSAVVCTLIGLPPEFGGPSLSSTRGSAPVRRQCNDGRMVCNFLSKPYQRVKTQKPSQLEVIEMLESCTFDAYNSFYAMAFLSAIHASRRHSSCVALRGLGIPNLRFFLQECARTEASSLHDPVA